jgi:hypothetical protein
MDIENQQFLETVIETSKKRVEVKRNGESVWRAQLCHEPNGEWVRDDDGNTVDWLEIPAPAKPERMKPLDYRANEGRVNPKGIPCFYCSTDKEAAMSETRPWVGSLVSVAQFVIKKEELRLVDCSGDEKGDWVSFEEPPAEKREEYVWRSINRAFTTPVTRNDDIAEYAPTQILAEAFKSAGYDGIIYGSNLGKGKNVAIFDLDAAEQIDCHLYRVNSVNQSFSPAGPSVYVLDGHDGVKVNILAGRRPSISETE